jgi:hypothetical protein
MGWSSPQNVDTKLSQIVNLLKLIREKISKSRIITDTIINNLNIFKNNPQGFVASSITFLIDKLCFQCREKTFRYVN